MVATLNQDLPSLKTTIQWLQEVVKRPPLPECPREAARTGKEPKQPAFISGRDRAGHPRVTTIAWKLWVDPEVEVSKDELRLWWSDSATGLGTLGGWNGEHYICWIDVDLKSFSSQEDCDGEIQAWMDHYPVLKTAHRFRSQSGGYRFLVACRERPEGFKSNSKFSLTPKGQAIGEVMTGSEGRGGHTVLPPTKGMKGIYTWEQWSPDYPIIVDGLSEIGIYPAVAATPVRENRSDLDQALQCLKALPVELVEDYNSWIQVGMACHQISHEVGDPDALLQAWIEWSQRSDKFIDGECEKKWRSFKASQSGNVGIGTLMKWAGLKRDPGNQDLDEATTLDELLALDQQTFPRVLPEELMHPLEVLAQRMGLPVAPYVITLLTVAAAMLPSGTQLAIDWTRWKIPAILWLGLVGESGSAKSPILNALTSPLNQLQREADQDYEERLTQYKEDLKAWEDTPKADREGDAPKPPHPEELYLSDLTFEGMVQVLKDQPCSGLPVISDELAGLVNSQNSYRSGRGADRQHWLSLYDGKPIKVNRKGSPRINVENPRVSLLGGIQPGVLERMLGEDTSIEDGFWPRFTWVRVPLTKMPGIGSGPEIDISPLLTYLYRNLRKLPHMIFRLDSAGIALWNRWHDHCEQLKVEEPASVLRATYPKGKERAARIAIILHCIEAALAGRSPREVISVETLSQGIQIGHWLEGQTRQIFAEIGQDGSDEETQRILKFYRRFRGAGWIKVRQVRNWWAGREKPESTELKAFMAKLVSLGLATDNGEPRSSPKYQIVINGSPSSPLLAESQLERGSQPWTTRSPSVVHLSPPYASGRLAPTKEKTGNGSANLDYLDYKWTTGSPPPEAAQAKDSSDLWTTGLRSTEKAEPATGEGEELPMTQLTETDLQDWQELLTLAAESEDPDLLKPQLETLRESYAPEQVEEILTTLSPELQAQIRSILNSTGQPREPRQACIKKKGFIDVDLDQLDLDYRSPVSIPEWKPSEELPPYESLSKLYLDIETSGLDPTKDRLYMVGFKTQSGEETILTDQDEKTLLQQTLDFLKGHSHKLLIGHNIIQFDLPFLMARWEHHKIPYPFRHKRDRQGQLILQTISASSFHGKPLQFHPITCPGVEILDTFQQICIWDKSAAKLESYGLKAATLALGLRSAQRLDLSPTEIKDCWVQGDLDRISEYLRYDLEDTKLLADFLLPVVYYQLQVVPVLSLQDLAVASPALKAQKIHLHLLPKAHPDPDHPVKYGGGLVECLAPGLHRDVAKIDISSLYPSIMLRYGICSKKDPEHRFLGVMQYMTQERLRLKKLAKEGNTQAGHEQNALKILINGSYGFLGTGGYTFNDYEAAALVTAYGRKILKRMEEVVRDQGGTVIELDTDGIFFSHPEPEPITEQVQQALPDEIRAELELSGCGMYVPKAKSYVIVHPNGKTTIKGIFRKRNRYPLEKIFPVEFLKLYFLESEEKAMAYYQDLREAILQRRIPIEELIITRKIGSAEKQLLKLGKPWEIVSYFYTEQKRIHSRTSQRLPSVAVEATEGDYWAEWYLEKLDQQFHQMMGSPSHESVRASGDLSPQLPLL